MVSTTLNLETLRNVRAMRLGMVMLLFFWVFIVIQPCQAQSMESPDVSDVPPCHAQIDHSEETAPPCCDGAGVYHDGMDNSFQAAISLDEQPDTAHILNIVEEPGLISKSDYFHFSHSPPETPALRTQHCCYLI